MESWIARRIRTTALRRFTAWTLVLIVGGLLATSDHRYITNFFSGPYTLTRSDLDSIADVALTPRYFAHVKGERVIDTGIRQYTVHTQAGVETDRSESGAYRALVFGNRFLVVRTASATASDMAEGKLLPRPADFDEQLFDSKEMRELKANFYPFYLDGEPFRKPGYIVIVIGVLFLALFAWKGVPSWRYVRDAERHPLAARIAKWGDPMGVAVNAEREFENPLLKGGGGWRCGDKYLIRSTFFSFDVLRLQDVVWGYKKITKHSVNFIPTGKTYEALVMCYGGNATIPGKEARVNEILAFAQQRAPWAVFGYSDQLAGIWNKNRDEFVRQVEARRQEWQAKQR
jgi:hypothetical protein